MENLYNVEIVFGCTLAAIYLVVTFYLVVTLTYIQRNTKIASMTEELKRLYWERKKAPRNNVRALITDMVLFAIFIALVVAGIKAWIVVFQMPK